jgi:CheY-like chemotaxis protein
MSNYAEVKDISLILSMETLPKRIIGDRSRFEHVLENCVAESIDQTNAGGVNLRADTDASGTVIYIDITDTRDSRAINPDSVISDTENRMEDDISALVSEYILRQMGGRIDIDAAETSGCHRVICFPIELPDEKEPDELVARSTSQPSVDRRAPPKTNFSYQPKTVMVVDDSETNIRVAACFLRALGCKVFEAASGCEAIRKLAKHRVDAMFIDCQMPKMTGLELTQAIRDGEAGVESSDVFIAAMTASTGEENKVLCLEAGMNHFISKPVNKKSFIHALAAVDDPKLSNLSEYKSYNIVLLAPDSF